MECSRSQELLSDLLEGALHQILRSELDAHLAACEDCRSLREAMAEVVETLHAFPDLNPPEGLAERVAAGSWTPRPRAAVPKVVIRPAVVIPSWVQAAAAGLALIALGVLLMVVGPEAPTRVATGMVDRTVSAGSELIERKDRIIEDVRILGVVLTTAFEGRLERVNERVEDYRRLLERRRSNESEDSKRGSETRPLPLRVADAGFRTGTRVGS